MEEKSTKPDSGNKNTGRRIGSGPRAGAGKRRVLGKNDGFGDQVVEIRRVSRVVAGGKRFSFRATVVVGDRQGKVGIGVGKSLNVAESIAKAKRKAEKNIFRINLKEGRTIPYDVEAKFGASRVRLKPARVEHGLVAGGSSRIVLKLAGVRDITAKLLGTTTNKLTNAMATLEALKTFREREENKFHREPLDDKKTE